jgi:hypothetical protein
MAAGSAPEERAPDAIAADAAQAAPPRYYEWAKLMRRAFDIDVLACPRCGGRLRLLGLIEDPHAVRAILESLTISADLADRAPPEIAMRAELTVGGASR